MLKPNFGAQPEARETVHKHIVDRAEKKFGEARQTFVPPF